MKIGYICPSQTNGPNYRGYSFGISGGLSNTRVQQLDAYKDTEFDSLKLVGTSGSNQVELATWSS